METKTPIKKYKVIYLYNHERRDLEKVALTQCRDTIKIALFDKDGNKRPEQEINEEIAKIRLERKALNANHDAKKAEFISDQKPLVAPDNLPSVLNIPVTRGVEIELNEGTGNTTLLLGSSKVGKSTLLMSIYNKYYTDQICVLFAHNPQISEYKDSRSAKKNLIVCNQFFPEVIRTEHRIQKKTKNKFAFCNFLDDILDDKDQKVMKSLVLSLRNSKISSVISLQFPSLVNKSVRGNINNVILFRFNSDEGIKSAIDAFLGSTLRAMGISKNDEIMWYKQATKDHQFIYFRPADGTLSVHRI